MVEMCLARPVLRQWVRLAGLVTAAVLLCGALGCSKRRETISAIEREYARGNCKGAVTLCEGAVRGGMVDGEILRFHGLSLLCLDRDAEAFEVLREAASRDRLLAGKIAADLLGEAGEALAKGRAGPAGKRARAAVEIDPEVELGSFAYLVAESFFELESWTEAAGYYQEALAEYPDTSAAEMGYFNLASCYAAAGDSASAIAALEAQLARFPRGPVASQAQWSLVGLLYARGRSEFQKGNYQEAIALGRSSIERAGNGIAAQRARFLIGESYERMGDYASAYDQYEAVVREDHGASGRIVELARAKMAAIRDAGLR